ncbi:hypothetical protein USDA257_p03590 (plasmid) [Sinorhizobium fredii USDA 257]|uniref:Uncharacterized protein n=1 Tax=Sinorhizobium fredii (strain USDA 257) TaxID=1185652 RepID=I3XGR8_SINF2|nr:hypothetical protein USDA257_p03590 [Sinorhizobium fredii USDA 257]
MLNPVYQFLHRHRQPPLAKDIDALMRGSMHNGSASHK